MWLGRIPSLMLTWATAAGLVVLSAVLFSLAWPAGDKLVAVQGPSLGFGQSAEGSEASFAWIPVEPQDETVWLAGWEDGPALSAQAAILFENETGTVLYAKNPHQTRAPASTTKILTAILALERGHLDDIVEVSRFAAGTTGSSARLYTGQKIRMDDLLHGLLLLSGNDAAVAIAEHVSGSVEAFARLMNQRAAELGATHSRFVNPHGLDKPGHFSTAYDLAMLARAALLYPRFSEIVAKRTFQYGDDTWTNTNKLLWSYEGVEGVKTGTTSQAGYCLVAAATQNGMQLISVVLGSSNRWRDSTNLLDYGFNEFHQVTLAARGDALAQIPARGGMDPVVAVANRDISVVVRDEDVARLTTQLHLPEVTAPIRRGDTIGTFAILVGDEVIKTVPLIAADSVERRTPFRLLWRSLTRLFTRAQAAPFLP